MSVTQHLEAAKAHIAVAESGDSKRAAYEAAADEIISAQAEDPTLSQAEVGRPSLDRSKQWVNDLLTWRVRHAGRPTPWADGRYRPAEPTRHEDKVEMAAKLLSDPEVTRAVIPTVLTAKTKASRLMTQAVRESDAEQRRKRAEQERQAALDKALPLPAYMAKMVEKMNEWSGSLAALVDDLDELPDGRGRELVLQAAENLADQAQRWVNRLADVPELDEGGVIEGEVILRIA